MPEVDIKNKHLSTLTVLEVPVYVSENDV
jgi:hypothetical protein